MFTGVHERHQKHEEVYATIQALIDLVRWKSMSMSGVEGRWKGGWRGG